MNITMMHVGSLKPYAKNARRNDRAVNEVAASIRDFGFKVPIVVRHGEIVAGHTRLKAAIKLGMSEVPVINADDLTEEQAKAFRLADNKTAEIARWNYKLLNEELGELLDGGLFEMGNYGFTWEKKKQNERLRTDCAYNLNLINAGDCSGSWDMPVIKCADHIPESMISFNYAKTAKDRSVGVHFFIDDYQFERVWNDMASSLVTLKSFDCVLSPDFSLYMDMPLPMKIWNVYRSRAVGHYWQQHGLMVIPTLSWAGEETFKFAFEGVPKGSIVAVSTVGVVRDTTATDIWKAGMDEAMKRIKPKAVLVYGREIKFDFRQATVKRYRNTNTDRMK